jgi:hypothetical protein
MPKKHVTVDNVVGPFATYEDAAVAKNDAAKGLKRPPDFAKEVCNAATTILLYCCCKYTALLLLLCRWYTLVLLARTVAPTNSAHLRYSNRS